MDTGSTKNFTNLPAQYKKFLTEITKSLDDLIQTKTEATYSLQIGGRELHELDKVQLTITKIAKENEIFEIDINRLILYCNSKNSTLDKLKDFVHLRNLKLLDKAIKSSKYKKFIDQLKEEYKSKKGVSKTEKDIESKLLEIWEKYFTYFNGLWKFIEYENGKVSRIGFIDPIDKEQFFI